jgi:protein-disulfide isomerase
MAQLKALLSPTDHVAGPAEAAVTLVEYGDYECPHCAFAHPHVAAVRRHFSQSLRFAFRHFPLSQVHPNAAPAAETAEFAGAHGRFWEMHDALFANQAQLGPNLFMALAVTNGLSPAALRQALLTGQFRAKVQSDFLSGVRSGVNGTPTFFIDGARHDGGYAAQELKLAIESKLHKRRAAP